MVDSVQWVESIAGTAVVDHSWGSTILVRALHLLALKQFLLALCSEDIGPRAIGATQTGACGSPLDE